MRRFCLWIAVHAMGLLAVSPLAGCRSAPKAASEVMVAPRSQSPEPPQQPLASVTRVGYWKESGNADPAKILVPGRRVIITEFDVELVDLQSQSPFGPQMAVKPPPIPIPPLSLFGVGLGMELSGLGRKRVEMDEDRQHALAGCLLIEFENDLRRRGLTVLPRQVLAASAGYAELKTMPVDSTNPLMLLNPVGADTGVVMHSRTVPAPGLAIVTDGETKQSTITARILRETGADVAMAVTLRVGVFHKKAALEEGSVISLDTVDGQVVFKARRSIVSDAKVVGPSRFRPVVGEMEAVFTDAFAEQLAIMLPKFLDLAFR